jgi:hypothetical protein
MNTIWMFASMAQVLPKELERCIDWLTNTEQAPFA